MAGTLREGSAKRKESTVRILVPIRRANIASVTYLNTDPNN